MWGHCKKVVFCKPRREAQENQTCETLTLDLLSPELHVLYTHTYTHTHTHTHARSKIRPVNHKGNQPWIFIGRTDAEPEAPIPWPPDVKSQLFGKTLMLGKIDGKRRGQQRMKWLDVMTDSMDMNLSRWRTGKPGVLQFMGSPRAGHNLVTEQQQKPHTHTHTYLIWPC